MDLVSLGLIVVTQGLELDVIPVREILEQAVYLRGCVSHIIGDVLQGIHGLLQAPGAAPELVGNGREILDGFPELL